MKTYSPKPQHIERRWYVVDAQGQTLGRMASEVAALLRGKHKPIFAPHMDTGDHVIVINAGGVVLTGGKEMKKVAYRHSGYPGGIKGTSYERLMRERPQFVVEKAVRGMLPKNRLGRAMVKKLHVVEGAEHPHQAQQPVPYTLGQPSMWEGLPAPAPKREPKPAVEKRAPAKKAATTEPSEAAKPPAKKTTARKTTATKPAASKTTATKKTTARRTTTAKASTAKKTTATKPAAKTTTAKKADEGKDA
jgi:large subunit ribosomal protein L13